MKINLTLIESFVQNALESGFVTEDTILLKDLVGEIVKIVNKQYYFSDVVSLEPICIEVRANPKEIAGINVEHFQQLLENLAEELLRDQGINPTQPLRVVFFDDDRIKSGHWDVSVEQSTPEIEQTLQINTKKKMQPKPNKAYLIINGEDTFEISQTAVNIGRSQENQIIFDDMRISRRHAQIRPVRNHLTVFDLSSTIGTKVNKKRISQKRLQHGDVIEIGEHKIIFVEEEFAPAINKLEKTNKIERK